MNLVRDVGGVASVGRLPFPMPEEDSYVSISLGRGGGWFGGRDVDADARMFTAWALGLGRGGGLEMRKTDRKV